MNDLLVPPMCNTIMHTKVKWSALEKETHKLCIFMLHSDSFEAKYTVEVTLCDSIYDGMHGADQ